jgi:dimethylamine/trimethylamine dehydrogenase
MKAGIRVETCKNVARVASGGIELACIYTGERTSVEAASIVMVTARLPEDLDCIGDAHAPALIAASVYAGHRYARECDEPATEDIPFRREMITISD